MKSFFARSGIDSHVIEYHDQVQEVEIKLDNETRDLLNYVRDLRNASGMHSGWEMGMELNTIVSILTMIYNDRLEEQEIRDRVPAVENAWENYKMLLSLAKKDNPNG